MHPSPTLNNYQHSAILIIYVFPHFLFASFCLAGIVLKQKQDTISFYLQICQYVSLRDEDF